MNGRTVSLSVDVADPDLPHVMEVLGRLMAGLIMEGVDVRIAGYTFPDDTEGEDT